MEWKKGAVDRALLEHQVSAETHVTMYHYSHACPRFAHHTSTGGHMVEVSEKPWATLSLSLPLPTTPTATGDSTVGLTVEGTIGTHMQFYGTVSPAH